MCICVMLLESLSRSFCSAVFNVAARILVAMMVILTVMARLVSLLHRIGAWMIAHSYVQHQCACVLFYSNRSHGHFVVLFQCCSQDFGCSDGDTDSDGASKALSRIVAWLIAHRYV